MAHPTHYHFEGQSIKEEIANSITHGIGAALSIAGTALLTVFAALDGSPIEVVAFSIFGFSLLILYMASTLYHGIQHPKTKHVFHVLDHSAIFVLIAGTYTPVTLVGLQGPLGWTLFGIIWGLAIAGIIGTTLFFEKARYINVILYVLMGWLVLIAAPKILTSLSIQAIVWLVAGGILYSAGICFYRAKSMKFHHMIWHVFVVLGSISHFFCMLSL